MPLYEFVCQSCHEEQELLVRGDQQPPCESCGSEKLQKLLSVPAGHVAKGDAAGPPAGSCGTGCGCFPG